MSLINTKLDKEIAYRLLMIIYCHKGILYYSDIEQIYYKAYRDDCNSSMKLMDDMDDALRLMIPAGYVYTVIENDDRLPARIFNPNVKYFITFKGLWYVFEKKTTNRKLWSSLMVDNNEAD